MAVLSEELLLDKSTVGDHLNQKVNGIPLFLFFHLLGYQRDRRVHSTFISMQE